MQEKFGMSEHSDPIYLRKALELAKLRRGFCAPNPAVGAVIVRDGLVIAAGHHSGPGLIHAEVDALKKLPFENAKGATLYVTLEPCCHFGRTPPCTDAIIKSGINRVVYGYADPNPIVAGKGAEALQAAGIHCEHVYLNEINMFYESYNHWHKTQKPFITAKIALSLDGKIAGKMGEPIAITGEALKEFTYYSRKKSDAILTTSKTIIQDDPQLNVRNSAHHIGKPLYILDSQLAISPAAKVFVTAQSITIFHAENADPKRQQILAEAGARCIAVKNSATGLDLEQVIKTVGADGKHDLWIEAGGECFATFVQEKLLQRAFIYIGSKWLGAGKNAFPETFSLESLLAGSIRWLQFGKDVMCEVHLG